MKFSTLSFPWITILRVVQGLFALLVLILSAYVANWYNTSTHLTPPSQINFLLFAAVWSILSITCIELIPRFLQRLPKTYIAAPLDVTNAIFYLAGFAALAAFLNDLLFCRGNPCQASQADVAFAAFSFAVWTASAVLSCIELVRTRPWGGSSPAAAVGGAAAMQQTA